MGFGYEPGGLLVDGGCSPGLSGCPFDLPREFWERPNHPLRNLGMPLAVLRCDGLAFTHASALRHSPKRSRDGNASFWESNQDCLNSHCFISPSQGKLRSIGPASPSGVLSVSEKKSSSLSFPLSVFRLKLSVFRRFWTVLLWFSHGVCTVLAPCFSVTTGGGGSSDLGSLMWQCWCFLKLVTWRYSTPPTV